MGQINNVNNNITIADLIIGGTYSDKDIQCAFKCSTQGGMNRSHKTNTLVLFVKHNKSLYDDEWDNDILKYTGMGQVGDQSFLYAQNKTLFESRTNGVEVHLFECYEDGKYIYDGIVELADEPSYDTEADVNNNSRRVVKFPLKFKYSTGRKVIPTLKMVESCKKARKKIINHYSDDQLRSAAKNAGSIKPKISMTNTTTYKRSDAVSEHTKRRAKGYCDLCDKEAPFKSKNEPYLECHHVIRLADGGPDKYYNTVALCPNCHRKMHVLHETKDLNKLKSKIKSYLEDDNDIIYLQSFKDLFGE